MIVASPSAPLTAQVGWHQVRNVVCAALMNMSRKSCLTFMGAQEVSGKTMKS